MNREQTMNIIIALVLVAIVYLIYRRTRVPSGTQSEKMMRELYSIKDALIPKKYIEKYRSDGNNGLTIVGTMMEQVVDIMIAILKQGPTKEMIDTLVRNPADATTLAEAIETIGAQIVREISKNNVIEKKDVTTSGINKDGTVVSSETRTIYRPNQKSMTAIAENGVRVGALNVVDDTSKYDKYYEATKNILLDVERKTNPDATDERFPTKEVFKSEIMPRVRQLISSGRRIGPSPSPPSASPPEISKNPFKVELYDTAGCTGEVVKSIQLNAGAPLDSTFNLKSEEGSKKACCMKVSNANVLLDSNFGAKNDNGNKIGMQFTSSRIPEEENIEIDGCSNNYEFTFSPLQ